MLGFAGQVRHIPTNTLSYYGLFGTVNVLLQYHGTAVHSAQSPVLCMYCGTPDSGVYQEYRVRTLGSAAYCKQEGALEFIPFPY